MKDFKGICVPIVTPFAKDGNSVDEGALKSHIDWMIESGVHIILACGGTGEFAYLREAQGGARFSRTARAEQAEDGWHLLAGGFLGFEGTGHFTAVPNSSMILRMAGFSVSARIHCCSAQAGASAFTRAAG